MNNIGRNQSEQARKLIEEKFGLVSAEAQKKQEKYKLKPVSATKVSYGKSQTKTAVQNVLETVLNQYRFTSLAELNAVLEQYRVRAEREKMIQGCTVKKDCFTGHSTRMVIP